ncbi:Ccl17 [Columba guinea]|nr:Ccl17 [Columba guinea]
MLTARTALVLTALLTLSLCCNAAPSSPSECCYDYRNSRLPLAKLKGYYIAPPECFDPAIVMLQTMETPACLVSVLLLTAVALVHLDGKAQPSTVLGMKAVCLGAQS